MWSLSLFCAAFVAFNQSDVVIQYVANNSAIARDIRMQEAFCIILYAICTILYALCIILHALCIIAVALRRSISSASHRALVLPSGGGPCHPIAVAAHLVMLACTRYPPPATLAAVGNRLQTNLQNLVAAHACHVQSAQG